MTRTTFTLPALLLSIAAASLAARPSPGGPEELISTATRSRLTGPAGAAPGYVRLGLRNESDSVMAYELVRLRPGVTPEAGMRAVRVMHRLERGDTAQAKGLLESFHGGAVYVAPGETKYVATTLEPGTYVAYADVITSHGPRLYPGYLASLLVRNGPRGATAPAARQTLRMLDFAFEGPRRVPAGQSLWRVENRGKAAHLAFVARLRPGKTVDDLKAEFAARTPGMPASVDAGSSLVGVHALSTGQWNDVELALDPGEYVVGCVIDGHHLVGMLNPLTVTP